VTALKLSSRGGGLSMLIRPEMRAVSIEVNQVSGVSGFVLPGDRVDVLSTLDPRRDGQEAFTSTLLQSVEVLAAGQKTQQGETRPMTVQSVTLLVDPRGAEMLAHAQNQGELHLVLRNPEDQQQSAVASFTTRELLHGAVTRETIAAPEIAVASNPPPTRIVTTTRSRARVRTTAPAAETPSRAAPPTHIRIIRSSDVVETPAIQDSTRHQ
jgi:pilus assembly protein CpaB